MKKFLYSLLFVLFATANVFATDYFVKPDGNNSSAGTSWATAWSHPNKGQSVMSGGDRLIIAPGSYDTVQFVPPQSNGSQTAYICSTAWVDGSDAGRNNTFLNGGRVQALTWSSAGTNLWNATFDSPMTGVSPRIYVALFRDGNICDPRSSTSAVTSQNKYAYNPGTNVFTLYSTTNPSSSTFRVAWRPVMDLGPSAENNSRRQSNILIYGLTIQEGSQRLFVIGDWDTGEPKPDSVYIMHCNLKKVIELEGAHNGSIILTQTNDPVNVAEWSNDLQVVACSLSQISTVDYANGTHAGVGFEGYFVRDSRIDSNVFVGPMGSAIALKMGCYTDNGVKSLNWSIKYNRISGCIDEAIWLGNKVGNLDFVGNIVENCEVGFNIHTSNPCGNDPTQGNIKVLNNTFVNNDVNFTASAANSIGGNKIKYNIFFDTSGAVSDNYQYTIGFRLRGGEAPLETPSTETYWANGIDSNMYWLANGQSFSALFMSNSGFAGATSPTQAQWVAHFDQRSIFNLNPNFTSSHTGDYSRPSSATQMNVTAFGQQWTRYGAWQSGGGGCTPLSAPTLSSPADGAIDQPSPITLDWSDISGATNYRVDIDNNSNFSSPEISAQSGTSTYNASTLSNGTTYYWRASGFDACGWGAWSSSRSFTVSCPTLSAPTLSSPSDGSASLQQPIVFDWSDVSGVTDYQIQIDNNSDYSSTAVDQVVIPSTLSVNGIAEGTTFYWRVRARDGCGYSSWTSSRTFSTYVPASGKDSIITSISSSANDVMNYNSTGTPTFDITGQSILIGNAGPEKCDGYSNYTLNVAQNAPMDSLFAYFYAYASISEVPCNIIIRAFYLADSPPFIDGASGITDVNARAKTTAYITWTIPAVTAGNWYRTPDLISLFDEVNAMYPIQRFGLQFKDDGANGGDKMRAFRTYDYDPAFASTMSAYLTANSAPTTPSLSSPSNGATINIVKPTLTWTNSTDADGNTITYNVDVSTSSSFATILSTVTGLTQGTTTTSWQLPVNLNNGITYYWRVRSNDGLLFSSYSSTRNFVVSISVKPPLKKKVSKR